MAHATKTAKTSILDMMLEIVVIPVSDVDRAKISTTLSAGGWMRTSQDPMTTA